MSVPLRLHIFKTHQRFWRETSIKGRLYISSADSEPYLISAFSSQTKLPLNPYLSSQKINVTSDIEKRWLMHKTKSILTLYLQRHICRIELKKFTQYTTNENLFLFQTFVMFWRLYAFFWVIPPASEFYMPTFRNTLSVQSSEDRTDREFRNVGI